MEEWLARLKQAYVAGYYKTEEALDQQLAFPWQGKTCKDCPFWSNSICQIYAEYRAATALTCPYFNPGRHAEGQKIIQERQWQGFRRWWDWFNDRGNTR